MTFASSETQGESVGSRKTAAKLFKAWRESPKSPWDVGCDLPRVHSGDWRLAIGDWRLRLGAKIVCDSLGRFVATATVPNRGPASVARLS